MSNAYIYAQSVWLITLANRLFFNLFCIYGVIWVDWPCLAKNEAGKAFKA